MQSRLIIVEGAQGAGKTTFTNLLRDKITQSILYRNTGLKEQPDRADKTEFAHAAQYYSIYQQRDYGLTHIMDRTFTSEMAYSMCKYTPYDWTPNFETMLVWVDLLVKAGVEVYYYVLEAPEEVLIERLKRDKPQFNNVKFDIKNSLDQQKAFKDLIPAFAEKGAYTSVLDATLSPDSLLQIIVEDTGVILK